MSERLDVISFLGLPDVSLEIRDSNILIGPQAAGKSVCAKLFYYCKSFLTSLDSIVENDETKNDLNKKLQQRFYSYFSPWSWPPGEFQIYYQLGDFYVKIDRARSSKGAVKISTPSSYARILREAKNYYRKSVSKNENFNAHNDPKLIFDAREWMYTRIESEYGARAGLRQIYVPAGRSFFANLQRSIFTFLSSNNAIDPFLQDFGAFYEALKYPPRNLRKKEEKKSKEKINQGISEVLKGQHSIEKGLDYLVLSDERKVPIGSCSSGQQELLPLAILLKFLAGAKTFSKGFTVYIEEPEAHIFPDAQRKIISILALAYNLSPSRVQFVLTTHSPYVLTALNNHIQAGYVSEKAPEKKNELSKILSQDEWLFPEQGAAYSLTEKGAQDIMDSDGIICSEVIDAVSDDLSEQFDSILDMDH
mgnify:CR=1 FL=1